MKKTTFLTLWVLIFCLLFSYLPVLAAETAEKVEIEFSVGDDTLLINKEPVTVEKPYVVGEGVTLVPLRVITEAFGAEVNWIAETQTITLSYPDVEIVLQINNKTAEVNKNAETLLSAPELTKTGFTMVPLRFISETFGATVTYDEKTRKITVVKESADNGDIVSGAVDTKNIGDSFYGWTMENPTLMQMEKRNFDGTYTVFSKDDINWFDISIIPIEEDYDFERDFVEWKNSFTGYTLVKADKDTTNAEKKVMHFQAKDKTEFNDVYIFITPEYLFTLWGSFDVADNELRTECLRLLSTFDCTFHTEDTHDLSNVKDGYRNFSIENLGFSMDIPTKYYMISSEDVENEVSFIRADKEDDVSDINIAIYSKSDVGSAETLAKKDLEHNKKTINESIATFTGLSDLKQYKNISAYEYTIDINASSVQTRDRDVFFEAGDYVYNVSISVKMPNTVVDSFTNVMINSIKVNEVSSDDVGILMRNFPDDSTNFTLKQDGWTIELPNSFTVFSQSPTSLICQNMIGGNMISLTISSGVGVSSGELREYLKEVESVARNNPDITVIKGASQVVINKEVYFEFVYSTKNGEELAYCHTFIGLRNNKVIECNVAYPEMSYSEHHKNQMNEIIGSLTFN